MFVDLESDNADIHVMDLVMLADVIRVCKRYEEEKEAGRRRTPDEKSAMIVRKALLKGALEMPLTALAKFGDYSFRPDACAITGRKSHVSAPLLLLNSALETAFKESCKTATTLITPLDGPTILEAAYYWSFQKPFHVSPLYCKFPAMTFTRTGSSLTDVAVFNSWFLETCPGASESSLPTTLDSNATSLGQVSSDDESVPIGEGTFEIRFASGSTMTCRFDRITSVGWALRQAYDNEAWFDPQHGPPPKCMQAKICDLFVGHGEGDRVLSLVLQAQEDAEDDEVGG